MSRPCSLMAVLPGLLCIPLEAFAHHTLLDYEEGSLIELAGEVESIFWRNPHIRLTIRTVSETGEEQTWNVEGGSVNAMERLGISPDIVHVGDSVTISGHPSSRIENSVRPVIITLASGETLALDQDSAAAFGLLDEDIQPAGSNVDSEAVEVAIREARGIFRVWTNRDRHWLQDVRGWWAKVQPLREDAKLAKEAWDPEIDDFAKQCIPAGMPETMLMPFPIEFVERDGNLELHIEEWDNVRTIHMGSDREAEDQPTSSLGYSVGHWEDNTLVVRTNRINYPYFDDQGTPMSEAVEIVEHFTLSGDDTRLDWAATVVDPETFTEPVQMPEMHWDWAPGEELKAYNCTVDDN